MTEKEKKDKKREHPRRPWRDNLEAITMAIIMAVLLKYFIVEAYKIPTGSMQPTLMGNDETGIHDRILVDKLSYHFRDPQRWEVVVFKYPLDRSKNFIKRIVGMPSEDLRIFNGDLWVRPDENAEWQILHRPDPVLDVALKPLIRSRDETPNWKKSSGAATWQIGAREIQARGDGTVRFPRNADGIKDNYRDGYPGKMGEALIIRRGIEQNNPVGDLRVDGEIEALAGCTAVTVELREGNRSYRFVIPGPAAEEDARLELHARDLNPTNGRGREVLQPIDLSGEQPYRLEAGKSVSFRAQNLDDVLSLELGGQAIFEQEIPMAADQASAVYLAVSGRGADLSDLMISRDVYYQSEGAKRDTWPIPDGHYVMLGDNTQDSSDAREWIFQRYELPEELRLELFGRETDVDFLRANYHTGPSPNPREVTGGPRGTMIWARDEWGELYSFPRSAVGDMSAEDISFVPRHLIVGRALVVFWPFVRRLGVYRMGWIR